LPVRCVFAGRMIAMAKAFPIEIRNDVVAVARKGEAPVSQIAKDFGGR
jgi:transposase